MIRDTAGIPFSWSLRRQEMWNQCRRKYFLHYYAARGGHDADASPELRRIHEMRSLVPAQTYIRRTIAAEFRHVFYAPHEAEDAEYQEAPERILTGRVLRRFHIEFRRMLIGEFHADHGQPMLYELYYNTVPPEELRIEINRRFRLALEKLESGVLPMLSATRHLFRRPIESPLEVYAGELRCHIAPLISFETQGLLHIVESTGADSSALLHKYHAASRMHVPPDRVRSLELLPEEGALRQAGESLNIGATLKEIRDGAAEMALAIRPDGTARLEDFPRTPSNCPDCRFRNFCREAANRTISKLPGYR